jgi:arsenate reductase
MSIAVRASTTRIEAARPSDLAGISVHGDLDGETMNPRLCNVLFLCTGNSARSVLAEVLINRWGAGKFVGFSAGSYPKGEVNPLTLRFLKHVGLSTEGLRSKSWNEFAGPGAPPLDFVFTVCDQAAGEVCPVWPGQPITAHWGVQDPAAVEGTDEEKLAVFNKVFRELESRIKIFCSLPLASLDRVRIKEHVDEIGRSKSVD